MARQPELVRPVMHDLWFVTHNLNPQNPVSTAVWRSAPSRQGYALPLQAKSK